jgi:hypothetical protein
VETYPGLTSWGILSRPFGTDRGGNLPRTTSWAILSRPCGTERGGNLPRTTPWAILSRPFGTERGGNLPRTTSWAILSRPFGTDRDKPGELICFQRVRYKSGASKKANLNKTDSRPSPFDKLRAGSPGLNWERVILGPSVRCSAPTARREGGMTNWRVAAHLGMGRGRWTEPALQQSQLKGRS